jgi:hypothetical protein
VEERAILICLVGTKFYKNVEKGCEGERIEVGGGIILMALHMQHVYGGRAFKSDFECFKHNFPIWLEALLSPE